MNGLEESSRKQPSPSDALVAETSRLEREVAEHKRVIGQHRRRLHVTMAALEELRRRCQELGIGVRLQRESSH